MKKVLMMLGMVALLAFPCTADLSGNPPSGSGRDKKIRPVFRPGNPPAVDLPIPGR